MRSPPERAIEKTRVLPPHSLAVAAFSTIVEWYDFTLYLYFATVLARVFYGGGRGSLLLTLGGFAIAYLMRPLGAVFFSHIGDKRGRRRMMLMSVALMTAAMLATALLPTRAAIGPAAGWLLLVLRCVMGFSVGGEYTGVVAYLLEGAPARRRGLITSSASAASEVGGLLAVGVSALTVGLMSAPDLDRWGWRIPFFVGAALAASVWVARSTMHESPEFVRQQDEGSVPELPLKHALTNHRIGIARSFSISALGSITYYVGITYVPAFLTSVGPAVRARGRSWLSTIAAVAVILVTPLIGVLSDRIGRKPVLIGLCLGSAALPDHHVLADGEQRAWPRRSLGAVILALLAGAGERGRRGRDGRAIPGRRTDHRSRARRNHGDRDLRRADAFWRPVLVERTGWATAPGIMIAVVAIAVLPVLLTMRETAPSAIRTPSASS